MARRGKNYRKALEQCQPGTVLSAREGVEKVKELSFVKFDETVDVHANLGIDPGKGDQVVRGSVLLPHSTGRIPRIIVFAKGEQIEKATQAGADHVGLEELVEKISKGWLDFDYAVATPDVMAIVGKLAKILGPRGLLPNKKVGTVTFDVAGIVGELRKGRRFFKNDKQGLVHFSIGKVSSDAQALLQNLVAFMKALSAAKPASSKGKFLRKVTITSSMGPGIALGPEEVLKA